MLVHFRLFRRAALCAAMICFGFTTANAQTTTVIVSDDFSDGITNNGPQQIGFNTTNSFSALDQSQAPGPVDFASGNSIRAIHGLFTPQTLTTFGDRLEVFFDFTTPATVPFFDGNNTRDDFRFGVFNTAPAIGQIDIVTNAPLSAPIDFSNNLRTTTLSPNVPLSLLPGFFAEVDGINDPSGSELGVRVRDVNFPFGNFGSTLLNSTSGFQLVSDTPLFGPTFIPVENYQASLLVEFTDSSLSSFDITTEIFSASLSSPVFHRATAPINDVALTGEVGVNTTTFDFFGLAATGGAFGGTGGTLPGSSSTGEFNNGIDISRVDILFTSAAVPEPSSVVLLLLTGLVSASRRRR